MPYPRPSMNTHSPPVSYSSAVPEAPSSPPTPSTSRGRRPSLSNPMGWLSRNSTQSSVASVKPARISEPKLIHQRSSSRAGVLGSGATVVRTPDEALRDSRVRLTYDGVGQPQDGREESQERLEEYQEEDVQEIEYPLPPTSRSSSASSSEDEIPSPPDSPPLPPIPSEKKSAFHFDVGPRQPFTFPTRPSRVVQSTPTLVLRPSLKTKRTDSVDAVPALPANIPATPAPPAFNPILISEIPSSMADRSRIIVSLETCTETYKTTLDTLSSRPSHLSSYIASLLGRRRSDSMASSVYSTESADMSTYHRHLAAQGLVPQSSFSLHIFLDRPSDPYVHILNYLRSPCASPEGPEVLPPRAARAGLDTLLELRDESAYLGLDGLRKLCIEEIRKQHRPLRRTSRGHSSGASIHSMHASVSSLHTMVEHDEPQSHHSRTLSKHSTVDELGHASSAPESWAVGRHATSPTRHGSLRSPPPGWI
ncbi:hypothetical protein C8R47DRAFT_548060 [Mycena vitilis]|nr:hypothetical protein C8R47DRAFT_548060 [Mycena vitilis]